MGKIYTGAIKLASTIQPTGNQPLDDRVVVASYSDLLDKNTFGTAVYQGMAVVVAGTGDMYILLDDSKYFDETATAIPAEAWSKLGSSKYDTIIEDLITVEGDDII